MGIATRLHAAYRWYQRNRARALSVPLLIVVLLAATGTLPASAAEGGRPNDRIPLLAYYSIGYEDAAWDRVSTDAPLLGRYVSDDKAVMREHIRMAQQAGIDGFIVMWRNTPKYNRRLSELIDLANGQGFRLAVNYRASDGQGDPHDISMISRDLDYFIKNHAGQAAFSLFAKPVVIWSGSWQYSPEEIASVTARREKQLYILGAARTVDEYRMIAGVVDGNAYYWSSADPSSPESYVAKLSEMGDAVHAAGGLWIAPAAPGYRSPTDSGRVVNRAQGATLLSELRAAAVSDPDVIGLISWNVFDDGTHVEPSVDEGGRALEVVASVRDGDVPTVAVTDFDSSEPGDTDFRTSGVATAGGLVLLVLLSVGTIIGRNIRRD